MMVYHMAIIHMEQEFKMKEFALNTGDVLEILGIFESNNTSEDLLHPS